MQEAGEILVCLLDELESLGAIQVQLSTLVSVFDRPKLAAPDEVGSHKALGVSYSPSASRHGVARCGSATPAGLCAKPPTVPASFAWLST